VDASSRKEEALAPPSAVVVALVAAALERTLAVAEAVEVALPAGREVVAEWAAEVAVAALVDEIPIVLVVVAAAAAAAALGLRGCHQRHFEVAVRAYR
jgi:hypothetical protein